MTRAPRLLSLSVIAVLAVAACGGSAASSAPSGAAAESIPAPASEAPATAAPPSQAPASASPAAAGPDVGAAAQALDNIERYALEIRATGLPQVAAGEGEITMSGVVDRENDAYQLDVTGIAGLGALGGASGISFIAIGDDVWIGTDGQTFIKTPGASAMVQPIREGLAPGTLLNMVPAGAADNMAAVGQEDKNGVATTHYHVTGADSPGVAEGLGPDGVVDLWIADDGGYVVSMVVDGVIDVNGTDTTMSWAMDISRINDETISIEAPN
jgi:hypothetical protein